MIQKIVLVIMAVTSIFSNATAQDQEWKPELFYGLSAGQENFFFGLPKISLKLANTKPKLKPYIGSDLGL
jgi:hypothetical protein